MTTKKTKKSKETITPDEVTRLAAIDDEIKRLTAEKNSLTDKFKRILGPGNYVYEGITIDITTTIGTLNKTAFMHTYPSREYPELYDTVPSTSAIKEYLDDEREKFYTPSVRLTVGREKK